MCNIDALKFYKKNDIYCHKRQIITFFEISRNSLGMREKNLRNVEISHWRDRPTIRPHIIFCIFLKFLAHYGNCQHDYTSKHINQIEDCM